ncbi:MAG: hypothetical protein ACRD0U_15390 [Acidimicrobiales bacterium]
MGALLGVLVLAIAVPAALIRWVGWPLPDEMPSLSQITDALRDTYIPDEFLINALAVVCWLVWIELMASLIVEAVAYAQGRRAGHVPMAGGVQRAAARLIATIALLGALATTKGVPDLASHALRPLLPAGQPSVTLVIDEEMRDRKPEKLDPAASAAAANPIYEVQRRDTLWDIAETHLGDPFRWVEIFELNRDQPQPDGSTLTDPDRIYPGWQLALPPDAIGLAAPTPPPAPAPTPPAGQQGGDQSSAPAQPGTAEDGLVLVDDSGPGGGGGVVAQSPTAGSSAGLALVPDDPPPGSMSDQPPVMAQPGPPADQTGSGGPSAARKNPPPPGVEEDTMAPTPSPARSND